MVAADWGALPDLLTLDEVIAITREPKGTAYNKLARGAYPIKHLPGQKPYRFPKAFVRDWVERGEASTPAVRARRVRRFPRVA
jgi:hypothetical protein